MLNIFLFYHRIRNALKSNCIQRLHDVKNNSFKTIKFQKGKVYEMIFGNKNGYFTLQSVLVSIATIFLRSVTVKIACDIFSLKQNSKK